MKNVSGFEKAKRHSERKRRKSLHRQIVLTAKARRSDDSYAKSGRGRIWFHQTSLLGWLARRYGSAIPVPLHVNLENLVASGRETFTAQAA